MADTPRVRRIRYRLGKLGLRLAKNRRITWAERWFVIDPWRNWIVLENVALDDIEQELEIWEAPD